MEVSRPLVMRDVIQEKTAIMAHSVHVTLPRQNISSDTEKYFLKAVNIIIQSYVPFNYWVVYSIDALKFLVNKMLQISGVK